MTPEQIKAELAARGWTIRDLADRAGMDENHLSKSLGKAARKFRVEEMDGIRAAFAKDEEPRAPVRRIPWLGGVPGGPLKPALEKAGRYFAISDPDTPARAYALTVEGDSMDLVAPDGTTIVIDPDDTDLWPNRRYVVRTRDGETTFKEFQVDPARLVPCSSNKANREVALGKEPITVLGRVISYTMRDLPRRLT
jgi:repressor LexA